MKKLTIRILTAVAAAVMLIGCALISACGDNNDNNKPANNREPYAGEYKFAGLKIYKSTSWGGEFLPFDGSEDEAFAELTKEFTKEYVLEEANKQYYEFNSDGSAVWHLATYISYDAAPVRSMNGTWDIIKNEEDVYITYTFQNGSTNYGNNSSDFNDETVEKILYLYSNFHSRAMYQFTGTTEEGYVTDNYWEIHALYKRVQSN